MVCVLLAVDIVEGNMEGAYLTTICVEDRRKLLRANTKMTESIINVM